MKSQIETSRVNTSAFDGNGAVRRRHACAFSGGSPLVVELQAQVRFRQGNERSSVITSGIPTARAHQILASVLDLAIFDRAESRMLRVDVHRGDATRYQHAFGLALGVAMVSSLARRQVPANYLFLGDVDLGGQVSDVPSKLVDRLNDAIRSFEVETPLTVVLAPDSARWVNASSTVKVIAAQRLEDAVNGTWPATMLRPW